MKEGDYVIPSGTILWEHFKNGPRKITSIRKVGGPEGDAITVEGIKKMAFWSDYLRIIPNK